ncbi:hypothetical protein FACS1894169_04610 [Bacteroidia bacterium]|nr:hypothetical protein FACS1894169_04610 [Bacteroidia bacterium]
MKNIIALLFCLTTIYIHGQDLSLDYQISSRQLSTQAYQFARYGNVPVKHFVGEADLSIPLYTYKDQDFTIPINLQYNGNGFMPNKNEGMIGLDWSLNIGGAITRQVNGVPDEGGDGSTLGIISASKHNIYKYAISFNDKITDMTVEALTNGITGDPYISHDNKTLAGINCGDLCPDNFNFYMPGHSGKFTINWDGKVQFGGNKPYRVIFSDDFTSKTDMKTITVIAPDGYKYIFGGNLNATETSTFFPDNKNVQNQKTITTAWFLTKIISPNGRKVEFIYKSAPEPSLLSGIEGYVSGHPSLILSKRLLSHCGVNSNQQDTYITVPAAFGTNSDSFTYEVMRQSSLEKIVIDEKTTISFSYKEKENKFYTDAEIPHQIAKPFNSKNMQMTGISVSYGTTIVKTVTFRQEYLGGLSSKRFFLTGVQAGNEKYTFNYYNLDKIPSPRPDLADHWGYYNGSSIVVPVLKGDRLYSLNTIIDSDKGRAANEELSKVGMLRRVVYPTGGGSLFHYGLHHWDYHVRKDAYPQETVGRYYAGQPFPKEVGGARINKIEDFNENGDIVNVKEYIYNNAILLHYPQYVREVINLANSYLSISCYTNPLGSEIYPCEKYIQYAEVIEKSSNNGSVIYRFSSYLENDNRDQFDSNTNSYMFNLVSYLPKYPILFDMKGTDRSYRRGLLTGKVYCNNENDSVYKEEIKYGLQSSSAGNYINALRMGHILTHKYKIENYAYLPVETKRYDYRGGNPMITTTHIEYNEKYLVKKETDVENVLTTEYKYPYDLRGVSPYGDMADMNVLVPVLEKKVSKSGVMLYEHTKKYAAKTFNGNTLYLPATTYSKNRGETESLLHTSFDNYDAYGNPVAVTGKDNISSIYLWGYRGIYPVAIVQNATYAQVKIALNNTLPESLSSADIPDMVTIENLREHSSLKEARITTYTYKPLVGVLNITAPDKTAVSYTYDSDNRPATIKDHSDKVLNSYAYNLTPTIPIDIHVSISSTYSMRYPVSFNAVVNGGSDQFTYDWSVKDNLGNTLSALSNTEAKTFSYKFSNPVEATVTCTVKDTQTGKSKEFTKSFEVIIPPVSIPSLSCNDSYIIQSSNTFRARVEGGSGEFSYDWHIKDAANQNIVVQQLNSPSDSLNATLIQKGTMNLTCKVKDNKSGLTAEKTVSFMVKSMALALNYGASSFYISDMSNISVNITNGSGSYQYSWKMTDMDSNTVLSQSSDARFVAPYTKPGQIKITCSVKDLVKGDTEEISGIIQVTPPPIQFTNIVTASSSSTHKVVTAEINCNEAMNLRFTIGSGGSAGLVNYVIGSSSYSRSTSGTQTLDIALPKGKSSISLTVNKTTTASINGWMVIEAVNSGNNTIGVDRVLNINL